jgi:hypothetical protein
MTVADLIEKGFEYASKGQVKKLANLAKEAKKLVKNAKNTVTGYLNKGQDFLDKVEDIVDAPGDGFNKLGKSAISGFNENVKKPLTDAKTAINKSLEGVSNSSMRIDKVLLSEIESIMNDIDNLIDSSAEEIEQMTIHMKNSFSSIIDGIDIMIQNFERIICFINEIPTRVLLLTNGIGLMFEGISNQLKIIERSSNKNTQEIDKSITYSAIYVGSSFLCLLNFLKVFHKCFIYYFLDFIRRILYLPIGGVLWILQNVCKMNINPLEKNLKKFANMIDNAAYSLIKIKIFSFSEDIIKNCFTCIKLRKDVVLQQSHKQNETLSKEMNDIRDDNNPNSGMNKIHKGKELLSKSMSADLMTNHLLNGNS